MEAVTEEIFNIKKKLASEPNIKDRLELLKNLQSLEVNLDILKTTRIGKLVNKLRRSEENKEVAELTRTLIKKWKRLLNSPKNSKLTEEKQTVRSNISDSIRQKSRSLLADSLKMGLEGNELEVCTLAEQLEEAIFQQFKNANIRFRNKIRSLVANLRDPRNPQLKHSFRIGSISAQRLATMTHEDMASDHMKQLRNRWHLESFGRAQLAVVQGNKTDLLKCNKCKNRDCSYIEIQTRSADEPMTVFASCNKCGYRWRS